MSGHMAPNVTNLNFTASGSSGDKLILSGAPIQVYGISFLSATNATIFTIRDNSDNFLFSIRLAATSSFHLNQAWTAADGVRIRVTDADGTPAATVFHSDA